MQVRLRYAVSVCIAIHVGLLLTTIWTNFIVVDEPHHIASGVSHWQLSHFRADRVNPPLARMIAAVPVLIARPATNYRGMDQVPGERPEFTIGDEFIEANGARALLLTRLARIPGVFWSVAGAVLLWRWAGRCYGPFAALLAVAIWCFDPTVIANASVVTADVPSAVAALGASFAYWGLWTNSNRRAERLAIAGVTLGVALLTKFTLLLLPLMWLVFHLIGPRPVPTRAPTFTGMGGGTGIWRGGVFAEWCLVVVIACAVVNLGYGFHGSFKNIGEYKFVSRALAGPPPEGRVSFGRGTWGNRFTGGPLGSVPIPLPEDFVCGIDIQRRDFEGAYLSYLEGRWSRSGWWHFYLVALMLKEPLGFITVGVWGLAWATAYPSPRTRSTDIYLLIHAVGFLLFVSSQTGFSHHLRYLLPAYPFLILLICRVASVFDGSTVHRDSLPEVTRPAPRAAARLLLIGLLSWAVVECVRTVPHSTSYFNELAGGPRGGHRYLLFSNTDWGQDFLFLRSWIERHPEARPIWVAYHNGIPMRPFGLEAPLPPPGPSPATLRLIRSDPDRADEFGPKPGYYAVSAMELHRPDGLYKYLEKFRPFHVIGGSIFIYRLESDPVRSARAALGLPPLPDDVGVVVRAVRSNPRRQGPVADRDAGFEGALDDSP